MMRNMENKNYRFVSFLPDEQKKIPKKFEKLKNTIMDSFQAKIDWKQVRKREIKIIVPFRFVPTQCVIENSKKKIAKKLNKYHYCLISSQNRLEEAEKERK